MKYNHNYKIFQVISDYLSKIIQNQRKQGLAAENKRWQHRWLA